MAAPAAPPRANLTTRVIEALRGEIEGGLHVPGDKLPTEPALIQRFGVSRTVIREAVAELRAEGLVESRHGAGVFVLERPDPAGRLTLSAPVAGRISAIIEEVELRAAVEIEAAGLAALRAAPAQMAEIHEAYQNFAQLVRRGEPTAEADFAFHMAIARATNNARFEEFLAQLGRRTIPRETLRSAIGEGAHLPNRDSQLNAEHRDVAEAISNRDVEGARDAMRRHLIGSLERYRVLARRITMMQDETA
jgi:GntR family transcriptional regulator, transcriptional repressor for pyruvate dehydrogenase complex